MKLVNSFNETGKTEGYTDRILLRILDNLHLVFKNVNIRIEEPNKKPFYSIGLTLKEILVINTNDKWEPHFVDRSIDKTANIFKVLNISQLGLYLQVDETDFISALPDIKSMYDKMKILFPADTDCAKDVTYLISPISIKARMRQLNMENVQEGNNDAIVTVMIDLDNFETEIKKEQFNCIIYILNHISKYQKYQRDYYETRKFSYFKPRDKKDKKKWVKFAFDMIVRQIKFLRGNRNIFSIPKDVLEKYNEKFNELFEKFFKNRKTNVNYVFDEGSEESELFKEIVYNVDIKVLNSWSKTVIEKVFKNEKIEEKKYSQQSYFSYWFGYGSKIDESKLLSKEEEEKLHELFHKKESDSTASNKDRNDISIAFTLNKGSLNFIKKNISKNSNLSEGFGFQIKSWCFTLKQNIALKRFSMESTLEDFNAEMFTIVNKTTNHIALTFKSIVSDEVKLTSSALASASGSQQIEDLHSSGGSIFSSGISLTELNENTKCFLKLKFDYTPLSEINSTLLLQVSELSFTYHQVFLERLISFFKVEANEELTNKALNSMKNLTMTTQSAIKTNITKKNIIKLQIEPRKLIIPINKYDIKNSKILLLSFGLITMDTSKPLIESEIDIKYKNRYNVQLESFSMSYYKTIRDMKKNINRFDILTDISYTLGFALLKKQFSSKDYPAFKLFIDINNATLHLTEYLYTLLLYIMEVVKPTNEKDVWSQMTSDKKEIARNAKATAMVLKKNWMTLNWENFLAMISGGYIYFFSSGNDEDYAGYFYLKDSTINCNLETLTMKIMNMLGSIEIKFQNEKKFKTWEKILLERIEEMKTSYEEKSEEIGEQLKKNNVDPYEIYFGGEIILRLVNIYLYHKPDIGTDLEKLFSISIKELSTVLLLRYYDTSVGLSIQGIKIYDNISTIKDFTELLNSEDSEDKDTKLVTLNILLCGENSPKYKNIQMEIDLNIGYLYVIWNPIIIRKLLHFLAHNKILRNKVLSEITNPNEKLIEEKFIEPSNEDKISYPTCKEFKYTYLSFHSKMKKINFILIQPILNIFYTEMIFGESFLDCEMKVDHFIIKGELGNTQIFDLCEYPFLIPSQDKYNPKNKKEIFGIHNTGQNSTSLIAFEYITQSDWCPNFKDNYSSEANVKINSIVFVYVQEQFMRFLNYFLSEFLGALAPSEEDVVPPKQQEIIKKKDERDIRFMRLNLTISNPLIILKPRITFEEYFKIDLGNVNLTCYYSKVNGKLRSNPEDWRWMTTYQISLNNFEIKTHDNFSLLSPTNGIINMHFVYYGESDKNRSPLEFDFSYQFDIMFGDFNMNMRQKDYTLLLMCSDLNILYTDNLTDKFNYETLKQKKLPEEKTAITNIKIDEKEKKRLMADFIGMFVTVYIPKINLTLFLDNEISKNQFCRLVLSEMVLLFTSHLDYSKEMQCVFGDFKIIHLDEKISQVIVSDFTQSIHDYENDNEKINVNAIKAERKNSSLKKNTILIENNDLSKNKGIMTHFGNKYNKFAKQAKVVPKDVLEHLPTKQLVIFITIDIEREKKYTISLDNLKCLVRLDTIYLMQTFFMEGFPYYDRNMKDLPNLYDPNEDNYPGMNVLVNIKHPLICLLSEKVSVDPNDAKSIKNQEMYCISSEIVFELTKKKIIIEKEELLALKKSYKQPLEELKDQINTDDIKQDYQTKIDDLESVIWEMKCIISKISPFICDLDIIFDESSYILKRQIMKNFVMEYTTQTVLRFNKEGNFIFTTRYITNIDNITANMSFRDIILLKKTSMNNNLLLDETYQKNYESLRSYTHSKTQWIRNSRSIPPSPGIVETLYQVGGFNLFLIDNKSNTYLPFLSIQLSSINYHSTTNNNNSQTAVKITFLVLTYNYIAGLWEPLVELGNADIIMTSVEDESKDDTCSIVISPIGDSVLNVNISDLSIIFLFSIYERWMKMYYDIENKYEAVIASFDNQTKKMRVSSHTVFNYSGRKMKLYQAEEEKDNNLNINDSVVTNQLTKSYTSVSPKYKYKLIGEIEPNGFFEIQYPYQDFFHNEENIQGNSDVKIKFTLENANVKENEIKIYRIMSKVYEVEYQNVKMEDDLLNLTLVVSDVKNHDKKKYIYIYSPVCFKNKTQYPASFTFKKKNFPDYKITLYPKRTFGVPFEYLNGTVSVKINNIRSKYYPVLKFYSPKEILKELQFKDTFVHFYHPKGDANRTKVILLLTCYAIRNCLPFDINIYVKESTTQFLIPKGETFQCDMVSLAKDLNIKLTCLNFTTKEGEYETLYRAGKDNKTSKQIILYEKPDNKIVSKEKKKDKKKPKTVDIICTILKDNKITIILHPNTVLINQVSGDLSFFYGSSSKDDEIPGKGEIGTVFLLKSDFTNIHVRLKNYISDSFIADKPGTSRVVRCKKKKENKYKEFVMQNSLYLIATDLDLYCNIIDFEPKIIFWNVLKDVFVISSINNGIEKTYQLNANQKNAFRFFGYGEDIKLSFTVIPNKQEDASNPDCIFDSIEPFAIPKVPITTLLLVNRSKTKRKFVNVEMVLKGITTFYIFKEATTETAKITLVNNSTRVSMRVWQEKYENHQFFLDQQTQSIFTWVNPTEKNIIMFQIGIGKLNERPIMRTHEDKYEITEDQVVIIKNEIQDKQNFPYERLIHIKTGRYSGFSLVVKFQIAGTKFYIKVNDRKTKKRNIDSKSLKYIFSFDIPKIGISFIGDNTYIECKKNFDRYNRKEICYIYIKGISLSYESEEKNSIINSKIGFYIEYIEFDNQTSYITTFPITLTSTLNKEDDNNLFFRFEIEKEENKIENTKLIKDLFYKIQPFFLRIDSYLVKEILLLVANVTTGLKTSLTEVHPVFFSFEKNANKNIVCKGNYFAPLWFNETKFESSSGVLIQRLNASKIQITFSFLNQNKDKVFDNLLENNPVISKILSLLSNIENTSISIKGFCLTGVYGELGEVMRRIVDNYKEKGLRQIFKLFGNIEIIGTPTNLFQSLGTGVKEFFEKPVSGIRKGAVEGMKGIVNGSVSLVKNTVDGTLNTATKFTSGISKGLLLITQDDGYINKREKKIMTEKPSNFVEGLGYGLTSMAGGLLYGVIDIVRKPIEGAKKNKLKGFGKGLLQGLGGMVAKPISGILDMVSKTSEGLKNTLISDEVVPQARLPRPFYGKFKYIKIFNRADAQVLYFINRKIEYFKKIQIEYNYSVVYLNKDNTKKLLVFGTNFVYLIDINGYEVKAILRYITIKKVILTNPLKLKILFYGNINGKNHSSIIFHKDEKNVQRIFELFQEALNDSLLYK